MVFITAAVLKCGFAVPRKAINLKTRLAILCIDFMSSEEQGKAALQELYRVLAILDTWNVTRISSMSKKK